MKPIVENYDGKKFSWECQPGMSGLFFLIPRLKEHGVDWYVNAVVREILPDGVSYEQNGEIHTLSGYDTIVLAVGVRANNPLEETVKSLGKPVCVIGDANQPGPANKATEAALEAVLQL